MTAMKKYSYIIALSCFLLQFNLSAQEEKQVKTYHKFGLLASPTAGLGMAYKYVFGKHQAQLAILPVTFSTDNDLIGESRIFFNSTAINYFYKVSNMRKLDVLLFGGASHWYLSSTRDETTSVWVNGSSTTSTQRVTEKANRFCATLGFAFEVGTSERIKFNWHVAYAAYNFTENLVIAPSVGVGIEFALNQEI